MGEEKRRFIRTPSRLTAIFKSLKTGKVRRALTKDIGGGGLCLIAEDPLEPGTQLIVEIKLPDRDEPMSLLAEVIWSRPVGPQVKSYQAATMETGIKFIAPDPKLQALLIQYAKMNAPPPNA